MKWTPTDDALLRAACDSGTFAQLAPRFGRSPEALRKRAWKLNLRWRGRARRESVAVWLDQVSPPLSATERAELEAAVAELEAAVAELAEVDRSHSAATWAESAVYRLQAGQSVPEAVAALWRQTGRAAGVA